MDISTRHKFILPFSVPGYLYADFCEAINLSALSVVLLLGGGEQQKMQIEYCSMKKLAELKLILM